MNVEAELLSIIERSVSPINARSLLRFAVSRSAADLDNLTPHSAALLARHLDNAGTLFINDSDGRKACASEIRALLQRLAQAAPVSATSRTVEVNDETAVLSARSAAREMCKSLGFPETVAVRVITAVSELTRNIIQYARRGKIEITVLSEGTPGVRVVATDRGPGITNLEEILAGNYRSKTGMGKGLLGTKRLMDEFEIETAPGRGTTVTVTKYLR